MCECVSHCSLFESTGSKEGYLSPSSYSKFEAIYVSPKVTTWDVCSQIIQYSIVSDNMIPIYDLLVKHFRVLFYSGDVDTCVNYMGTERSARVCYKVSFTIPACQSTWEAKHLGGLVCWGSSCRL
jgi:hypothetical protein